MLVRRERHEDHAAVRAVLSAAFEDPGAAHNVPVEVGLVDALRATPEWLPQLSMVVETEDGGIVGYVVCSRGWDYPRFGFRPAGELGIIPPSPAWAPHVQVRTLSAYQPGLRGGFRYAQPFHDL